MKVILFKSESDAPDKFVEVLEKHNFNVQSIASIEFLFKNLDTLYEKLNKSECYEGIIFTSPRSIFATQQSLKTENDKVMMRVWNDKRNFTVGDSTYNLAKSILNVESKGSESGNAQMLSAFIVKYFQENRLSKPFLFPCGNLKQDILEKNLKQHSINLDHVEVYDTIPNKNLGNSIKEMTDQNIDYIVFFSPSGVKYSLPFIRLHNMDLTKIKVIAIGPSTKLTLDQNMINCYAMCEKPSPESLLNVLKM